MRPGSAWWLGWRDSNPRDAGVKVLCLTAWRQPKIHCHNRQKIKIWKRGLSISLKGLFLLGWVMRVELMISRATIWRPNQLGHTHHMARQEGLEPPTYCLEGSCSIQLSYWRIFMERVMGIEPTRPAWKAGILPLNYTRILHEGSKSNLTAFPRE